jgi:hypothetical protein
MGLHFDARLRMELCFDAALPRGLFFNANELPVGLLFSVLQFISAQQNAHTQPL